MPTLSAPAANPPVASPLDSLLARRDYYGLLNAALPAIAHGNSDIATALFAVQGYIGLGLVGPARELLTELARSIGPQPELTTVLDQLRPLPTGQVPWDALRERFKSNARRLYESHPHLQSCDAAMREAPRRFTLYRTTSGTLQVKARAAGAATCWHRGLCDWPAMFGEVTLPHDPKTLFCPPYIVYADHLGMLFAKVFAATDRLFMTYSPRIYFLQPDAADLGLVLHTADDIAALCHPRTSIFAGADCVQQFEAHLAAHLDQRLPELCVKPPLTDTAGAEKLIVPALDRAAQVFGRHTSAAVKGLRDFYDARSPADWAARFRDGRPLRILGMTSRFTTVLQYAMRDLKDAFERLGHSFDILIEPTDHDLPTAPGTAQDILRLKPDLMIVIDHLRREYAEIVPQGMPYVCWIQDLLPNLMSREAGRGVGEMEFYVAPSLYQFVHDYEYPAGRGMPWTMVTNDRLYSAEPYAAEALAAHRCDFSYVSNQSQTPQSFHELVRASQARDANGLRLIDGLYEVITADAAAGGPNFPRPAMRILADATQATGVNATSPEVEDRLARRYIHPLCELLFRQKSLEWVADYCDRTGRRLNIYGNGWDAHPRFRTYHRGVAANGEELRAIYQASTVNLQIISTGAIHQRLLDGLAAGGFFLIRSCPIDLLHRACEQFLAAANAEGFKPGVEYNTAEVPAVAGALHGLAGWRGIEPGERICMAADEMDFFRGLGADDYRRIAGAVFPHYGAVSFQSPVEFDRLADRYLADASARQAAAGPMRDVVRKRFTYDAFTKAVIDFIGSRLGEQSAGDRRTGRVSC